DDLAAIVSRELAALLGAAHPRWQHVTRWPHAIPQYTIGHLERIAVLQAAEQANPGLFLCGSYRGGVSVPDCVKSAYLIAERIVRDRGVQ
ncbi:MAG: protoporphyrinogen oxidase, partial [Pseudomonadota bacterium]|nr:protoporphyrinogen oxidase [Pseudomonadota bacterium]